MDFEEIKDRFSDYLRRAGYAERTIRDYGIYLRYFLDFLEGRGISSIEEVGRADILAYQNHLACEYKTADDGYLTPSTQAARLSAVKTCFSWVKREKLLLVNPAMELDLPRQRRHLPRGILTKREMERLLRGPDTKTPIGLRDRTMLEVLYSTGMRAGELLALSIYDVDFEEGQIRIRCGKGGKDRLVPVGADALEYLDRYIRFGRARLLGSDKESTLFLSFRGKPLAVSNLFLRIRKYARRTKIKKPVNCHSFRHTCATHLLKGGAGIRHIQAILGHRSLQTTEKYTKVEIGDLKAIHHKAHPRERMR